MLPKSSSRGAEVVLDTSCPTETIGCLAVHYNNVVVYFRLRFTCATRAQPSEQ